MKILNLAVRTPTDVLFYSRWERIGEVFSSFSNAPLSFISILVVDHRVLVTDELLKNLPNLKYIVTANTAHTHIVAENSNIKIISLKGEYKFLRSIHSVSEHVFNLIHRLTRPLRGSGRSLFKKKLLIVGYGRIGKHVAKIAKGYRMTVSTLDLYSSQFDWCDGFKNADFITIHLPENESTKKIISDELISIMKHGACLINTSRGSILDEESAFKACASGKILLGLDTVETDEFLDLDRDLIISNHVGGSTTEDRIKTDEFMVGKTARVLSQAPGNNSLLQRLIHLKS